MVEEHRKPNAKLAPGEGPRLRHPCEIEGWLDDDDPFFAEIDEMVTSRPERRPRVGRRRL